MNSSIEFLNLSLHVKIVEMFFAIQKKLVHLFKTCENDQIL